MEETNEELPNFSIGIDLLRPDPTSSKNKAEFKKLTSCAFHKFVGRPAAANFWPRDIHWEQKRHQLAINKKGKISLFIVVFKFVMHFVIAEQCDSIRKISLAITRQIHKKTKIYYS